MGCKKGYSNYQTNTSGKTVDFSPTLVETNCTSDLTLLPYLLLIQNNYCKSNQC